MKFKILSLILFLSFQNSFNMELDEFSAQEKEYLSKLVNELYIDSLTPKEIESNLKNLISAMEKSEAGTEKPILIKFLQNKIKIIDRTEQMGGYVPPVDLEVRQMFVDCLDQLK